MIKDILNNRFFQFAVAFVAGGFAMQAFGPEKIVTKTQVVIQEKIVTVVKEVIKHDNTQTHTVAHPDGTIVTDTTTVSTTTDNTVAASTEHSTSNTSEKTVTNPKRFHLWAGTGFEIARVNPPNFSFIAGMDATLWGPFTIGAFTMAKPNMVGMTLGIRW